MCLQGEPDSVDFPQVSAFRVFNSQFFLSATTATTATSTKKDVEIISCLTLLRSVAEGERSSLSPQISELWNELSIDDLAVA